MGDVVIPRAQVDARPGHLLEEGKERDVGDIGPPDVALGQGQL